MGAAAWRTGFAGLPSGVPNQDSRTIAAAPGTNVKHPFSRELFAYWTDLRGTRAAPERNDIDPAAIRRLLGDSFVLSREAGSGCRFRIAGTQLCALFDRELRGEPFTAIWDVSSATEVGDLCAVVSEEGVGVTAGAEAQTADALHCNFEAVLLPLSLNGRPGARMVGLVVPLERPYWLGLWPIGPLRLGTIQYLGPALEPHRGALPARLRRSLTVIEGGRT